MNLHSLWDGGFITKKLREQSNYTTPLPAWVIVTDAQCRGATR